MTSTTISGAAVCTIPVPPPERLQIRMGTIGHARAELERVAGLDGRVVHDGDHTIEHGQKALSQDLLLIAEIVDDLQVPHDSALSGRLASAAVAASENAGRFWVVNRLSGLSPSAEFDGSYVSQATADVLEAQRLLTLAMRSTQPAGVPAP